MYIFLNKITDIAKNDYPHVSVGGLKGILGLARTEIGFLRFLASPRHNLNKFSSALGSHRIYRFLSIACSLNSVYFCDV